MWNRECESVLASVTRALHVLKRKLVNETWRELLFENGNDFRHDFVPVLFLLYQLCSALSVRDSG